MKQQKSRKGTRIIKNRTKTGKTAVRYVKKKPKQAACARCGVRLQGVPRGSPVALGKMTRSRRRVSRKYGGVLCSACVRKVERYRARLESGYPSRRDLTIEKFLPEGWYSSLGVEADTGDRAEVEREKVSEEVELEETAEPEKKPGKTKPEKAEGAAGGKGKKPETPVAEPGGKPEKAEKKARKAKKKDEKTSSGKAEKPGAKSKTKKASKTGKSARTGKSSKSKKSKKSKSKSEKAPKTKSKAEKS